MGKNLNPRRSRDGVLLYPGKYQEIIFQQVLALGHVEKTMLVPD